MRFQPTPEYKIIRYTRALLRNPGRWIQRLSAMTRDYDPCDPRDTAAAYCFCLVGGLRYTTDKLGYAWNQAGPQAISRLESCIVAVDADGKGNLILFNDNKFRQHAQIVKLLDKSYAEVRATCLR